MKSIIAIFLLMGISLNSYANCTDKYEEAAFNRELRNEAIIVGAVVVATVAVAIILGNSDVDADSNSSPNRPTTRPSHNNYHPHISTHHHGHYHVNRGYYSHRRYSHRNYHRHYHRGYGYYYVGSSTDDRWLGKNAFDKVLMAYNDAKVWNNADTDDSKSSVLAKLNKKVAKKVIRLAKKRDILDQFPEIAENKQIVNADDKLIIRELLINGMEDTSSTGFCAAGKKESKALKRVKVINALAEAVIANR